MRIMTTLFVTLFLASVASAAQRKFEVSFSIADKSYSQTVGADTSEDARRLILSQYPKAVIKTITEIKD